MLSFRIRHGYPGGFKEQTAEQLAQKKPGEIIRLAVHPVRIGLVITFQTFLGCTPLLPRCPENAAGPDGEIES